MYYDNYDVVIFKVATTGLYAGSHILQIAAKSGRREFNKYIWTPHQICDEASAINGLVKHKGELYLHGRRVSTSHIEDALNEFLSFLRSFTNYVILVAHNVFALDGPKLMRAADSFNLRSHFMDVCAGMVDTVPMFRNKFPYSRVNLPELVAKYAPQFELRHALDNVRALEFLMHKFYMFNFDVDDATDLDYI